VPPPGWFSGDTHQHVQRCTGPDVTSPDDPDLPGILTDIRNWMDATDLNVANLAIWGKPDPAAYDAMRELVNGLLLAWPYSDPSINRLMRYVIETSGLSCSDPGHVLALRADAADGPGTDLRSIADPCDCLEVWTTGDPCPAPPDCDFLSVTNEKPQDGSGDLPAEAITLLRAGNPNVVLGYAHQVWSHHLHPVGNHKPIEGRFDWQLIPAPYTPADVKCAGNLPPGGNPVLGIPYVWRKVTQWLPLSLPVDVVFRRVDFLEGTVLGALDPETLRYRYYGAYYLLLSAGQRPVLASGSDADCFPLYPRTYVQVGGPSTPLTYDGWIDGLKAGRTTIANGPSQFLLLEFGPNPSLGHSIGDQMDIASPPTGAAEIRISASLTVADGASIPIYDPCPWDEMGSCPQQDRLEILVNGDVVKSLDLDPTETNPRTITVEEVVEVTESCWIAARQASGRTHTGASYVILDHQPIVRCDYAEYWAIYMDFLRWAVSEEETNVLNSECCSTPDKIVTDAGEARKVFAGIRDWAHGDPEGVTRHARSTYGPWGPIAIGVKSFTSMQRSLFCFNAPPSTPGTLRVGKSLLASPDQQGGYVGNVIQTFPVSSNEAGYLEHTVGVNPAGFPHHLYYQYVWDGGAASDVVRIPKLTGL